MRFILTNFINFFDREATILREGISIEAELGLIALEDNYNVTEKGLKAAIGVIFTP